MRIPRNLHLAILVFLLAHAAPSEANLFAQLDGSTILPELFSRFSSRYVQNLNYISAAAL